MPFCVLLCLVIVLYIIVYIPNTSYLLNSYTIPIASVSKRTAAGHNDTKAKQNLLEKLS